MYTVTDLYDKKNIIGNKLEKFIAEKSYTKTKLCKDAGISRPTLDKLISGELDCKSNYEKHMSKVLQCLSVTPDMLLSVIPEDKKRLETIRKIMNISEEDIENTVGISKKRLKEIEAYGEASISEWRDIALALSTGIRNARGTNYFNTQIALINYLIEVRGYESCNEISGFWGHIGIRSYGNENYHWFPITENTRKYIYMHIDNDCIIVPCMNNKLLFINMNNISDIVLLDEACDTPGDISWDYDADCGEIPLVIYESLEDYIYNEGDSGFSESFCNCMDRIIEAKEWSEDDIYELTQKSIFYYKDGTVRYSDVDFEEDENISDEVSLLYGFEEKELSGKILFYSDINGAEYFINMSNISMIELPLLKVEEKICKVLDEFK